MDRRYEIFISSTFRDLTAERQIIRNLIVQQDNFPAGMEGFVGGRPPWHHIEKAINSCDYYILIVGGTYGAINAQSDPKGLSFTECEYRLACNLGKEILPLVISETGLTSLPSDRLESHREKKKRLEAFRALLKRFYCGARSPSILIIFLVGTRSQSQTLINSSILEQRKC